VSRIDEIRARIEKATPGPLLYRARSGSFHRASDTHPYGETVICVEYEYDSGVGLNIREGDVALIENAQADQSYLLSLLKECEEALEFYGDHDEWIDFKASGVSPRTGKTERVDSHFDDDNGGARARTLLAKLRGSR
jgi:hypothetical protein